MEASELKQELTGAIKPLQDSLVELKGRIDNAEKVYGSQSSEAKVAKEAADKTLSEIGEVKARLTGIEQKITAPVGDGARSAKSAGEMFVESDEFKAAAQRGNGFRGNISVEIPSDIWRKTAIVNATPNNDQPLVQADRQPGVVIVNAQPLRIRQLLSTLPTSSNSVAFTRMTTKPTAAAPQGKNASPAARENVAKAESAMAFELVNIPVETIAHWIPASKQVLSDAPQLQGIINTEMIYGLKKEEDDELLNGDGTQNALFGLIDGATAYDTGLDVVGDTKIDTLRRAMLQLELAFHTTGVFVLNPEDWADIELKKDGNERYLYGSPSGLLGPSIWGRPVVSTAVIGQGDFLAFDNGPDVVQLFDRQGYSVTISTEHSDYFIRNMVAILCEERLALAVKKPLGLVTGSYPTSA